MRCKRFVRLAKLAYLQNWPMGQTCAREVFYDDLRSHEAAHVSLSSRSMIADLALDGNGVAPPMLLFHARQCLF